MSWAGYRNQIQRWRMLGLGMNPVGAFSPLDVAGLQTWIDFSDVTTLFTDSAKTTPVINDGNIIGAAEDKSGNGNDVLQAGADGLKPTYQVNEQNSLSVSQYDGVNDFLRATFTLNQPLTYYIVFAQITWVANRRIIDGSAAQAMIFQSAISPNVKAQAGGAATDEVTFALTTFGIARAVYNGATSTLRMNNDPPTTDKNIGANNPGGITLGASTAGGAAGNVNIGELLVYNSAISGGNDTNILSFLNSKWAIF